MMYVCVCAITCVCMRIVMFELSELTCNTVSDMVTYHAILPCENASAFTSPNSRMCVCVCVCDRDILRVRVYICADMYVCVFVFVCA